MANHLYKNDLPDGLDLGPVVAIDCETMGLNPHRDRLCVIQMSGGDGNAHLVQVEKGQTDAPNLCQMLTNPDVLKLFHFGRFDIAAMHNALGALTAPVYCTKIASKLIRTLHGPPRAEKPASRAFGRRCFKATADERLGRRDS